MSSVLDAQVFFLELDEITVEGDSSYVLDSSGHNVNGKVAGDAQAVADDFFVAAVYFDGSADYVDVDLDGAGLGAALNGSAFTVSGWINPSQLATVEDSDDDRIVPNTFFSQASASDAGTENLQIGVDDSGRLVVYLDLDTGPRRLLLGGGLSVDEWHYVALVFEQGQITAYIDDEVYAEATGAAAMSSIDSAVVTLAGSKYSGLYFNGSLRDFRVFTTAESEDVIKAIKSVDLTTAAAPSRQSVLIDFTLLDLSSQPTLYIVDNNANQKTTLTIENTSARTLSVPAVADTADLTEDSAPFWLQFRPGVLADSCFEAASDGGINIDVAGWRWRLLDVESDGSALLLLAPESDVQLDIGESLTFPITNLYADAAGGARGTRVMLGFQTIGFPPKDETDETAETTAATVSGYRQSFLAIVNQSGKRHTPLIMAFVGSNAIINNGSSNSFILSILNPSSEDVSLTTDGDAPTTFTFGIPVSDDAGDVAALVLKNAFESIEAHPLDESGQPADGAWIVDKDDQDSATTTVQWTFTAKEVSKIEAHGHIEFEFTNVQSTTASGKTLIAMHYQNLPGYWDGYLTAAVEKGPISYEGDNVGIGTESAQKKLHVLADNSANDGVAIENEGAGQPQLLFRAGGVAKFSINQLENSTEGNGLEFRDESEDTARVTIDSSGNVGIGTKPGYKLDVYSGDVRIRRGNSGDMGRIWTGYHDAGPAMYVYHMDDPCTLRFRSNPTHDVETGSTYDTDLKNGDAYESFISGWHGRIGIGTLYPETSVHMTGRVTLTADDSDPTALTVEGDAGVTGKLGVHGVTECEQGLVAKGTFDSGSIPATGAGVRMMWYPKKAAFRAGYVAADEWNDGKIGKYSIAAGSTVTASGLHAVAMGFACMATGSHAVAIGSNAYASGDFSIALGNYVSTNGKGGAVVIGDLSSLTVLNATAANQFMVRAAGGTIIYSNAGATAGVKLAAGGGSWASASDVALKEHFVEEDGEEVLARLADMPIRSWNYKTQDPGIRHIGPTAQDFRHAFGVGDDDTTITAVDADGVALLGLQALERRTNELRRENETLKKERESLEERLARIEALLADALKTPGA